MYLLLRQMFIYLFGAVFFVFAAISFLNTQFQFVPDHDHAELRSSQHHHDNVYELHYYTHRHAPDQPEHTHDKSQCYSVASGFTALVACEAYPTFYQLVITNTISYFQHLKYANIFISSIFRPPIV